MIFYEDTDRIKCIKHSKKPYYFLAVILFVGRNLLLPLRALDQTKVVYI